MTQSMASMSEAGLRLLDSVDELASDFHSLDRAKLIVDERNKMNQESYEVVSDARDALRKRLGNCATCLGITDGICPSGFDYSE